MAAAGINALHDELFAKFCEHAQAGFSGLAQAARVVLKHKKHRSLRRKFMDLDVYYAWNRHYNSVEAANFVTMVQNVFDGTCRAFSLKSNLLRLARTTNDDYELADPSFYVGPAEPSPPDVSDELRGRLYALGFQLAAVQKPPCDDMASNTLHDVEASATSTGDDGNAEDLDAGDKGDVTLPMLFHVQRVKNSKANEKAKEKAKAKLREQQLFGKIGAIMSAFAKSADQALAEQQREVDVEQLLSGGLFAARLEAQRCAYSFDRVD